MLTLQLPGGAWVQSLVPGREPRFLIWPGEKREETKSHRLWFQPRNSNLKGGQIRSLANLGKPPIEEGGNRDSHWGQWNWKRLFGHSFHLKDTVLANAIWKYSCWPSSSGNTPTDKRVSNRSWTPGHMTSQKVKNPHLKEGPRYKGLAGTGLVESTTYQIYGAYSFKHIYILIFTAALFKIVQVCKKPVKQ